MTENTKSSMAQDVADFHKKYGIQYDGPPRRLPRDLFDFRVKRTLEEVDEYRRAAILEDELDAQIDLIYIALGTLHVHGFTPDKINEAWQRVHEANMAKERCSTANPGKGHPTDIVKPKGWKAPNHSDLCQNS